jgi:hypothetical protein
MKTLFQIIHYLALSILLYLMAISMLEWFSLERYRHLSIRSVGDFVGLFLGIGLCASAFWCCTYSRKTSLKGMLWIYIGLFLLFVWFATILYPFQHPREILTLDPRQIELQGSQFVVSLIALCFIVLVLLSIAPILKIRELRGVKTEGR